MTVKQCVLFFGLAVIYSEYLLIEAYMHPPFPIGPPKPKPEPWRKKLKQPFVGEEDTVEESWNLYTMGLNKDPCRNYCSPGVMNKAISQDCNEMVLAVIHLARSNHPRVKPECASAKNQDCQYDCKKFGFSFSCLFVVTVTEQVQGQEQQKSKPFKLKDCLREGN